VDITLGKLVLGHFVDFVIGEEKIDDDYVTKKLKHRSINYALTKIG